MARLISATDDDKTGRAQLNAATKSKIQLFSIWCTIVYLICVFVGWALIPGFLLPPTSPSASANEIWALYQTDYTRIRIGMVVLMFGALVFIPFASVVSQFISRVEGGVGTLTYIFLLGAAGNMVLTFYPAIWWLTAAFRPERSPELIYLLNDTAWLQFLGGISMYLAMPIAITVAAFCDDSPNPVFPRWAGYANAWLAVIIVPDQLIFFFHQGPFAWNGIFGLWIPAVVFSGFFLVNFYVVRLAILRERSVVN
jgi:hypothetical protein